MQCPCNPEKKYSECCQKAHHSTTRPSKQEKRGIGKWTKSVN